MSEEDYIASYAKEFTKHLSFSRPRGFQEAYAEKKTPLSTEGIFQDTGGSIAWVAYYLTKRAAISTTHFNGQAALNQTLESLESMTKDDRVAVARKVNEIIDQGTKEKIQNLIDSTEGPSKKRRESFRPLQSSWSNKAGRANNEGVATAISTPACSLPRPATEESEAVHGQDNVSFVASDPSVHRLKDVFPSSLAGSVRRIPPKSGTGIWTAAITMSFVDVGTMGNRLGSMMSIEIASNKAQRFASILFGVEIESHGNYRYIILPNGTKISPNPDFVLRGSRRDIISKEFGDASKSLEACPTFRNEDDQGIQVTDCVTMTISNNVADGAFINLYLDDRESLRLKEKLYE